MTEVAGEDSEVSWSGTFVLVLLPGTVIGALLGWAEWRRCSGDVSRRRRLVWSPMLFGAILLTDTLFLLDLEGGTGLAAVGPT